MSEFDVLSDPRFDNGWLRENFEKLSDAEILMALVQIATYVRASCGRPVALLGLDLGTETREMLVDALTSMSNVDW